METLSKGKFDKQNHQYAEFDDEFFDAAFDAAFDQAFEQATSAPASLKGNNDVTENMRDSWLKVQREINKMGKQRKRMRTLKLSGVVAASIMLGAVIFSMPTGMQAVSPFVQTMKDWGNGVKSIIIQDRSNDLMTPDPSHAKTAPPPERGIDEAPQIFPSEEQDQPNMDAEAETSQVFVPVEVTEEEARSGFIGDFLLSNAIPERFTDVTFELLLDRDRPANSPDPEKSDHMRVRYSGTDKDGKEEVIQFDYVWIYPGQIVEGPMLRETSVVDLKDGSEAFMSLGPPYNTFQWMMGSTNVSLFGTVSEEEMLAIANDLQKQRFPSTNP